MFDTEALAALVAAVAIAASAAACAGSLGRAERDVVFAQYAPQSRNDEIARRVLPPLTYRRMKQTLAAQHQTLAEQAIDLAAERFDVYVPDAPPPPGGYGLIVFIAPWEEPTRPQRWRAALDRHHLILVAAQHSGNGQTILDRRLPLALLGYHNARTRYPIDDRRVYVAGFSGGSRVAEVAALAYPDVFRGAVLAAGSDPIDGRTGTFKPPAELFRAFQRSRLVYLTGDQDLTALDADDVSQASLRESCVLDVRTVAAHGVSHDAPNAVTLDRALEALEAPGAIDAAALARCDAGVQRGIAAAVAEARAAIARGDRDRARALIKAIDARFAGLAAHDIVELDAALDPQP
jgi:pimeloyl-ACP methyl ester carboxylesterase